MSGLSEIVAGNVEQLATGLQFTEGPVWHPDGYWLFVDTHPNLVYKLVPGGKPEVYRDGSGRSNGLTFDLQGRLIMCEAFGRRLSRREPDGAITTVVDKFQGKRLNRPNDVVCRSDGSIYFTDPQGRMEEGQQLEMESSMVFRVAPDGAVEAVVKDVTSPNGLAFSPDELVFYLINTRERQILAADVDPHGRLHNRRVFVDMSQAQGEGVPDGMKVDVDGRVYSTGPGGLWVLDASGRHLGTLPIPEPPSNCAWGGDDYGTMLLTARTSVYSVEMKTRGVVPPGARSLMR